MPSVHRRSWPIAVKHLRLIFVLCSICVVGRLLGGPVCPPEPVSPWVEPERSLVDPNAPPALRLCQMTAWIIFLSTDQLYAEYRVAHDGCTANPDQLAAGWDEVTDGWVECCPDLSDPDALPEIYFCQLAMRATHLIVGDFCAEYVENHNRCSPPWDYCCPDLSDPTHPRDQLLCELSARHAHLLADPTETSCAEYIAAHNACKPCAAVVWGVVSVGATVAGIAAAVYFVFF